MASGYAVWHLVSYLAGEPVSTQAVGLALFCSTSLALALTCLLLVRLACPHAPACASSLVIALGEVTRWQDVLLMAVVVVWITVQAGLMNRFAGLPVPTWSPRKRTAEGTVINLNSPL